MADIRDDLMFDIAQFSRVGVFVGGMLQVCFSTALVGVGIFLLLSVVFDSAPFGTWATSDYLIAAGKLVGAALLVSLGCLFYAMGIKNLICVFLRCYLRAGPAGVAIRVPSKTSFSLNATDRGLIPWQNLSISERATTTYSRRPFGGYSKSRSSSYELNGFSLGCFADGDSVVMRLRKTLGMSDSMRLIQDRGLEVGMPPRQIKELVKTLLTTNGVSLY